MAAIAAGWLLLALLVAVPATALADSPLRRALDDLDSLADDLILLNSSKGVDLNELVRSRVSDYVSLVQRTLGLEPVGRQRSKRALEALPNRDPHGVFLLRYVKDRFIIPAKFPNDLVLFSRLEGGVLEWYAVALETDQPNPELRMSNHLVLYKLMENRFLERWRGAAEGGVALAVREMDGWTYVVVAEHLAAAHRDPPERGSRLYRLAPDGRSLVLAQTLLTPAPTDLCFWEFQGSHFLGVAAWFANDTGVPTYATNSLVYKWQGEHLDIQYRLPSTGARAIVAFSISGQHYIAVANHIDNQGETSIDSTVFRLSLERGGYVVHQRLRTHGVMDLEFFSMQRQHGQNHFLAVANSFYKGVDGKKNYETTSVVYKWTEGSFVPFQSFQLAAASQWTSYSGAQGELVLFAACSYGLRAYQYDGWRFREVQLPAGGGILNAGANIARLRSYNFNKEAVLVVSSKRNAGNSANVLELLLERRAPVDEWYGFVRRWCSASVSALRSGRAQELLGRVRAAPKFDTPVVAVAGGVVFLGNSSIGRVDTKILKTQNGPEDDAYRKRLDELHVEVLKQQQNLDSAHLILRNALRKTAAVNVVPGRVVIERASLQCPPGVCEFSQVSVGTLNGESADLLVRHSVRLDEPLHIPGTVHFSTVRMDQLSASRVLGQEYPLVSRLSTRALAGNLVLGGLETSAPLRVDGTIDGVRLHRDSVLLLSGDQTFNEPALSQVWQVDQLDLTGRISGMQLDLRVSSLPPEVLTPWPHTLPESVSARDVRVDGLFGGLSLADVLVRALRTRGPPQVLTGAFDFAEVAAREVRATSLNGVVVERDVARTDGPEVIRGTLNFNKPLVARAGVQVYRRLGPVAVARDGSLDLLLAGAAAPQIVTGDKWVRVLEVTKRAELHGRVLGLQLPAVDQPLLQVVSDEVVVDGDVEISGAVRLAGPLRAEVLVDETGRSLKEVLDAGLRLDSGVLPPGLVIDEVEVSDLRADVVNDVPTKYWIPDSPGAVVHVTSPTTFLGDLAVLKGSTLAGNVNNVNLVALDDQAMKRTGDQIITGIKSFSGISATGAWSNNTVLGGAGLRWGDLWRQRPASVDVPSNVILNAPLVAQDVVVASGKVNDLDVKVMMDDSVFTDDGHLHLEGSKTFVQGVAVRNLVVDEDISGTGVAVLRLLDTQVADDEIVYVGDIDIENPISAKHVTYHGKLDGVSDSAWSLPWMEVDGDQTLHGTQVFKGAVEARGGVNVTVLNNLEVQRWVENLVRIDEPGLRFGVMEFADPVFSNGLVLAGAVAGVNLSDALLSRQLPGCFDAQVVSAPVVLSGGLQVEGSLRVEGLLAGENFRDLCAFANPTQEAWAAPQRIDINGNLLLDEEMVVQNVNSKNMKLLLNNTWMRDRPTYIPADMTFKDLNLTREVKVDGRIDGVSLDALVERYVSLSGEQPILTRLRVIGGVVVEGDLISGASIDVDGMVQGQNLKDFKNRVLLDGPDQDVLAPLEFDLVHAASNFTLDGRVNGLNLLEDVARLDRDVNVVRERKTVQGTLRLGSLDMEAGARLQGVDMTAWSRDAVRVNGDNQRVAGVKTFRAPRVSSDMGVAGLVTGVRVDREHLLLRHGDQDVRAAKALEPGAGQVRVEALELTGKVNNVDMRDLLARQAYRTGDVTVVSPTQWLAPLRTASALVDKTYHGVNVSDLINAALHPPRLDEFALHHEALLRVAERVQASLRAQSYYLNYFHWALSLRGAVAVLPLGWETDPAWAIAVVRRIAPGAPLPVDFYRWHAESGQIVDHPSLKQVQLPPSVRLVTAARWADKNAMYWEIDESNVPGVGLHKGYVLGLLRDGQLGLAELVRDTQPSAWVHLAALGSRQCLLRGSAGLRGGCALHCLPGSGQGEDLVLLQPLHATLPVHAVTLSVGGVPHVLVANAAGPLSEGGVDIWRWEEKQDAAGLRLVQTIGVVNATALATIEFRGVHYLATASGRVEDSPHAGMVHISRYDVALGNWTQWLSLEVDSPVELQFAALPSDELVLYVTADCADRSLHVFLYRGVAGFVHKATLAVPVGDGPFSAFTTVEHQHVVAGVGGGQAVLLHAVFKGSWEASLRALRGIR